MRFSDKYLIFLAICLSLASACGQDKSADAPAPRADMSDVDELIEPVVRADRAGERKVDPALVDEKLSELYAAINQGTLESLQAIRLEQISELPLYQSEILPRLKSHALVALRQRFSASDYQDWARASFSNDGGPSKARQFVDDVTIVHRPIGVLLETAAHLYSRLYRDVMAGKAFVVEHEYDDLMQHAEEIFANRKKKALPARFMLDPDALSDVQFLDDLEQARGDVIMRYVAEHPDDFESQIELFSSVKPSRVSEEFLAAVRDFLTRMALDVSPSLRQKFFYTEHRQRKFRGFADFDPNVRRALAQLYAVGAVDNLERDDQLQASKFLRESFETLPGLKSQRFVEAFVDREFEPASPQASVQPTSPSPTPDVSLEAEDDLFEQPVVAPVPSEPAPLEDLEVPRELQSDEILVSKVEPASQDSSSGSTPWALFVILFGVAVGGALFYRYRKRKAELWQDYSSPSLEASLEADDILGEAASLEREEEQIRTILGR